MISKKTGLKTFNRSVPKATDSEHLYEIKLVVLAPAGSTLERVLSHVMAAILFKKTHPLSVVVGYGASMKLLTDIRGWPMRGEVSCTSIVNEKIGRRETIPVLEPLKREKKARKVR